MSKLILHYAPDNASLCVRLALEAVGLPYDSHLVDRATQAQKSATFTQLNPNGLIPVLETPDGPLFETAAILLWLAKQEPALLPPNDEAQAVKWLIWMSNTLHPTLRMLFYPDQFIDPNYTHALTTRSRARLVEQLSIANTGLADQPFIGQPVPTILDCYLCPMLRWMQLYPMAAPNAVNLSDYPTLYAIARTNEAHPGTHAAIAAEGLGPQPFTHSSYPNPPEGSAT